jgi:hypothetical protein
MFLLYTNHGPLVLLFPVFPVANPHAFGWHFERISNQRSRPNYSEST